MARGSPPASAKSCSCPTTRPSGAAAASAWRSLGELSPSTAAASTSATTHPEGHGLQSSCRAEKEGTAESAENAKSTLLRDRCVLRGFFRVVSVGMKPTILIVDDEPGVRTSLSGVLRDEGYGGEGVASGEAWLERVTRGAFDLIVLDVWLPGMDGLGTLARMRERQVDAQIV